MALSSIAPIIDLDFSSPSQSNAVTGINWNQPGDVDLKTFYPTMPAVASLYFAKTGNCRAKVYIDQGIVLEVTSNSTANLETFAFGFELPAGVHDKEIYVLVEFDVVELTWPLFFSSQFLGAILAITTESPMRTGVMYTNKFSASTCQLQRDSSWFGGTNFRLNAPGSTGGQLFQYTPFNFLRWWWWFPPATTQLAFANRSSFPLVLEHTITASDSAGIKADIEVNLSQNDAAALKYFVRSGGDNKFQSNTYQDSLNTLGFAGVGLSVSRPQGITYETNPGPIRVRVKRLGIYYA